MRKRPVILPKKSAFWQTFLRRCGRIEWVEENAETSETEREVQLTFTISAALRFTVYFQVE